MVNPKIYLHTNVIFFFTFTAMRTLPKKIFKLSGFLLLSTTVLFSCKNENVNGVTDFFKPAVVDMSELENELQIDSTFTLEKIVETDSTFTAEDFAKFYSSPSPIWLDKFGLNENGKKLLTQIRMAKTEGLNPADYFYEELDANAQKIEDLSASELRDFEYKMSYAYLKYAKHLLLGRIKPLEIDKNWQNKNDTTWSVDSMGAYVRTATVDEVFNNLRPQQPWYNKFWRAAQNLNMLAENRVTVADLPATLQTGDSSEAVQNLRAILSKTVDTALDGTSMLWNSEGVDALKKLQADFGLEETGELDSATMAVLTTNSDENIVQLGMNMERMRWLQKDFYKEYIWVNVPEMDVKYFENDSITFKMNAVVGKFSRKTPTLDSKMSNIVFNPPWYVPPTILKQEIIPGIARRGGSYLRRRGLVARDRRGRIVNASKINSKNYRRYSISQNPGRNSALGSVKFNFPNSEAIFLHDTNHRGGFTRKYRASSSGCIRVHHPKDFAKFLLRDSTYNATAIDSIIKRRTTKSVKIKRDIGVHLVYLTNAVDSAGRVVKVNDIYKWDKKLAAMF